MFLPRVHDSQLRYALSDRLDVSRVARNQPLDPCLDSCSSPEVSQAIQPRCEYISLEDAQHCNEM